VSTAVKVKRDVNVVLQAGREHGTMVNVVVDGGHDMVQE